MEIPTDGAEFALGTLTHENRPTTATGNFQVRLTVSGQNEGGGRFDAELIVQHQETPDLHGPVDDIVSILGVFPTFSKPLVIDGVPYLPVITRIVPATGASAGLPEPKVGDLALEAPLATAENADTTGTVLAVWVRIDRPDPRITAVQSKGAVARTQSDEYVEITNTGGPTINLKGWQVSAGDKGQVFTFPDFTLVGGHHIRIHTNQVHPQWGGFTFGSSRPIWNDQGDTGELRKPDGTIVSTHTYGTASA